MYIAANLFEPGIERVQVLADISRSVLCCQQRNRTPIANPPNNAQLEGTLYHSPRVTSRSVSVRMRRGTDRHTDTQTGLVNSTFRLGYASREMQ